VERLRRSPYGIRIEGLLGFALTDVVQDELGIDKDAAQLEALKSAHMGMRHENAMLLMYPTPEESDDPVLARAKLQAKYDAELTKILKPEQYTRLRELDLQLWTTNAILRDPELWTKLGITADQQQKLGELDLKFTTESRAEFAAGGARNPGEQQPRPSAQDRRQALEDQVLALLTPEQKAKLTELEGKPVDRALLRKQLFPAFSPTRKDAAGNGI
jgi:hypothetical protein